MRSLDSKDKEGFDVQGNLKTSFTFKVFCVVIKAVREQVFYNCRCWLKHVTVGSASLPKHCPLFAVATVAEMARTAKDSNTD